MKLHLNRWIGVAAALTFGFSERAGAQELTKLQVLVFSPPSLSAFLPPIIKAQKFDQANGLDLSFPERTPDAYSTQFNSGEFDIGGAGTLQLIGNADTRGIKVKYLFNLFDYWGAVVTSRDNIKTIKDLEGKEIAAARATTNYQMFEFFAKRQGVDVSKFKVVNTATAGLVSYAVADRADAIQIWEPAYTLLMAKKPGIRTLDLNMAEDLEGVRGGELRAFHISASPPMPNGPTRTPIWSRSSTPLIRPRPNGSRSTRMRRRR